MLTSRMLLFWIYFILKQYSVPFNDAQKLKQGQRYRRGKWEWFQEFYIKGIAVVEEKIWASSNLHLFLKKNLPGHPRSWWGVLKVARHVSRDGGHCYFALGGLAPCRLRYRWPCVDGGTKDCPSAWAFCLCEPSAHLGVKGVSYLRATRSEFWLVFCQSAWIVATRVLLGSHLC